MGVFTRVIRCYYNKFPLSEIGCPLETVPGTVRELWILSLLHRLTIVDGDVDVTSLAPSHGRDAVGYKRFFPQILCNILFFT